MQQTSANPRAALDAKLVNAVVGATQEVLATMTSTDTTFKDVKAISDYKPSGDISAIIGISGEQGEGMFALSFPLSLANLLVGRLVGVEPEHVSPSDRCDGVGELINMIGGHTKATLSQGEGTIYKISLPTVIQGGDHVISSRPKNNPYLIMVFEAEEQTFALQVSFKQFD